MSTSATKYLKCTTVEQMRDLYRYDTDDAFFLGMASVRMDRLAKAGQCLHIFFTGENMEAWLRNAAPPFQKEQYDVLMGLPEKRFMLHFLGGNSTAYLCELCQTRRVNNDACLIVRRGFELLTPGSPTDDPDSDSAYLGSRSISASIPGHNNRIITEKPSHSVSASRSNCVPQQHRTIGAVTSDY